MQLGPQNLYELNLELDAEGKLSDSQLLRFGIREVSSELNEKNYRAVLNAQFHKTILLATHDPRAAAYASIRHYLDKGVLVEKEKYELHH